MRLRSQFILTVLVGGIIAVVIAVSVVISNQQVARIKDQGTTAANIQQEANDLSYLANDYLLYQESQQLSRWGSKFASLSNDLAKLKANTPEQQSLLNTVMGDRQRLEDVFNEVKSSILASQDASPADNLAFIQVSWSRIEVQSQSMVSGVSQLTQLLDAEADQVRQTNIVLVFALMGIFFIFFIVNYLFVNQRLLKSLLFLQDGTKIIGSGNLDYLIQEKGKDEIGELSHAFNRMTSSLKTVTASKADLEKEINDRKQAEAALQAEKERLLSLVNSITDEVWFADKKGNFTLENAAALLEFGYKSTGNIDIVELAKGLEVYHPDGTLRPVDEAPPLRALKGEVIKNQEEIVRTPARAELRYRQVSAAPVKQANGEIIGSVSVVRDITEEKKSGQALRDSEQRYRALFENMIDGYAHCRMLFENGEPSDFVYLAVNKSFERLTGLRDVVGKRVTEVIPGIFESNPELLQIYGRVSSTGQPERLELYLDQLKLWLNISVYSSEKGNFTAVFENITVRKNALESLQHYTAELEAANKELEAFSYSVSHDLRAPLRGIDGFSNVLLEDYGDKLDTSGQDYLHRIRKSSQLMSQLIDDMLTLSRISRTEIHPDNVNLSEMVNSIVEEIKKSQPERIAEFIIPSGITTVGDKVLLDALLHNLLENAWKFTGKCKVTQIEFGTAEKDNISVYYIKDSGIGFDMKFADKLFKPFSRLHNQEDYPGTGIGLANVQRIVHRHGGRVWAEGEPGKGATFYFTLGN